MVSPEPRIQRSGDALAAAFELVATPALFAFFGWRIDEWLGTGPAFLIGLTVVTAIYAVWRLLQQYDREMAAHEAARLGRNAIGESGGAVGENGGTAA